MFNKKLKKMPLLKKKPFVKAPIPADLKDNDEVFWCEITGEIFKTYEEFSERMFLCSSMVWTCSMTGKSNLTYSEAKESEENAKKSLNDFPKELKIPLLYVATKTNRTSFGDMVDDVFSYLKDRYFIGENIEVCVNGFKWKDSHVIQVIAPPVDSQIKTNGQTNSNVEKDLNPDPKLYKYEVEKPKSNKELMIVDESKIKRKRTIYSRERIRLLLKQYVEQTEMGYFIVKKSIIEKYNLDKFNFQNIFDGPEPVFEQSNSKNKNNNNKKVKQETLLTYFNNKSIDKNNEKVNNDETNNQKTSNNNNNNSDNNNKTSLLEKLRQKEEEFREKRQVKERERLQLKAEKRKQAAELEIHLKNWYKPKEDLELEDQKILPKGTPVKMKISDEYIGDMFMIMEFIYNFSDIISLKEYFPRGITVDLIENALISNSIGGPLIDIIQMLLDTIFKLQEEEDTLYSIDLNEDNDDKIIIIKNKNLTKKEAINIATIASSWPYKYYGVPLKKLPLYTLTTSEILRLHLLSSGAKLNENGIKDDPGLDFLINNINIVKYLSYYNVNQLNLNDKLKILSLLINQLLTYEKVKEKLDNERQSRIILKNALLTKKTIEYEFKNEKRKLKNNVNDIDNNDNNKLTKLIEDYEKKLYDINKIINEQKQLIYNKDIQLGYDRAYRQYIKLESVPGLFICNSIDDNIGTCLNTITKQYQYLINADSKIIKEYLKNKYYKKLNLNDKENEPSSNDNKHDNNNDNNDDNCLKDDNYFNDLLLCSTNPLNCPIHSINNKKYKWEFFYNDNNIDEFINCLNKRGKREMELLEIFQNQKDNLKNLINQTPVKLLNYDFNDNDNDKLNSKQLKKSQPHNTRNDIDDNFGYQLNMPINDILEAVINENILELEEKIHCGNLGHLKVNREHWRQCLLNKNYKDFDRKRDKEENDVISIKDIIENFDNLDSNLSLKPNKNVLEIIQTLAIALSQIANGVDSKCLLRPLGNEVKRKKHLKILKKSNLLNIWERSLLSSTSFSQLFLHYATLESCIMWWKGSHKTRCKICRRKSNDKNDILLICDSCHLAYHMNCVRPKLSSPPTDGNWLCKKCKDDIIEKEITPSIQSQPPIKKTPIFRDEHIDDDDDDDDNDDDVNDDSNEETSEHSDYDSRNNDYDDSESGICDSNMDEDVCIVCSTSGDLLHCNKCDENYHLDCLDPPLRRPPRGIWTCNSCKDLGEDEVINRRTHRREELSRTDLPLHNSALHELLSEIMKDNDAWPFLRPVPKNEVPDYYDVITKPMDFGTIKYKLNMGEYRQDADLMADALLVFQNCNTYNHTEDDVYKCGVRLLKHFQKKSRELGLTLPPEMDYDNDERPRKKLRTK